MPEGEQDHGRVPVTVAVLASGLHQLLDLGFGQVLSHITVRLAAWRHCPIYGVRDDKAQRLILHGKSPSSRLYCPENRHLRDSCKSQIEGINGTTIEIDKVTTPTPAERDAGGRNARGQWPRSIPRRPIASVWQAMP
jgi:hypothetical protein